MNEEEYRTAGCEVKVEDLDEISKENKKNHRIATHRKCATQTKEQISK